MLDFSAPSICKNVIFFTRKTFLNVGPILVFLGWNLKKLLYCGILHQYPQVFPNTNFCSKIKILKFGTKNA